VSHNFINELIIDFLHLHLLLSLTNLGLSKPSNIGTLKISLIIWG